MLFLGGCPEHSLTAQLKDLPKVLLPPPGKRPPTPLLPAEQAWLESLPAPPSAGGAMDLDRVYVPLQSNMLTALDRESGAVVWTRDLETAWSPVVGDGSVFVATQGELLALDPVTGEQKWRVELKGAPSAPLSSGDARVLVITAKTTLTAFRANDGASLWTRELPAPADSSAAFGLNERISLALTDGRVVALSTADGSTKWERQLPGKLGAASATRDRVLVGSTDNFFYALDGNDGDIEWKWRTGGDVIGATADDDGVYFASLDNIVRRVNRGNGHQRWKRAITTRPLFPPHIVSGTVVVAGLDPALSTFDGRTGAVGGTYDAPGNPAADLQGPPLLDPVVRPFKVAMVVLLRDGRAVGLRPVAMMFREPPPVPFVTLPGRTLSRERLP